MSVNSLQVFYPLKTTESFNLTFSCVPGTCGCGLWVGRGGAGRD